MDKWLKKINPLGSKKEDEVYQSQYLPVTNEELTEGTLKLWDALPAEVKYDEALKPFRDSYEKEHGIKLQLVDDVNSSSNEKQPPKRLPSISSAPLLTNGHFVDDVTVVNSKDVASNEERQEKVSNVIVPKKKTRLGQATHVIKITILIGVWTFFTVVFLLYGEKKESVRHISIDAGEVKNFVIASDQIKLSVLLKISGPFVSEARQKKMNSTDMANMTKLEVWLENWVLKKGVDVYTREDVESIHRSEPWTIILNPLNKTELVESETHTSIHELSALQTNSVYAVVMRTNSDASTPITLVYNLDPLDATTGLVYACILLLALYGLIVFEIINRTMAAVLLSTASLAVLSLAGERPSLVELVTWVDVETLLLLFSMMLLVALMQETGIFDYLAVATFQLAKGRIWPLITVLSTITVVVSLLLDNVTNVLLMSPVTIRLCEVVELDPVPILILMVLFCNLGGTITPVGDPPNIIIATNKQVINSGINFTNFTVHMLFGIVLTCAQTYLQLRFMFRDVNKLRLHEPRDVQELRRQIAIWRRAADSLPQLSRDEIAIRERVEKKIRKLTSLYKVRVKEAKEIACPKECYESTLNDMRNKYRIKDKVLLVKCCVAIVFVVLVFFLHSIPQFNNISLGWTALLGALLLLTLADREDLEPILHRVEWSTLLFFAALFVLMEALSKLGLIDYIGNWTEDLILRVDESDRLAVALVILIWVSGITSAFVDNVPLTTMMIRVVTSLGTNPMLNLPMAPLVWALSFGVCLGGNGTLIGASSNVVCAGIAQQHGYQFSFMQYFKIGFPVMIGHLIVVTAYLLICHCVFEWH